MREVELPSAGLITGSMELRRKVANAVSYVEVAADRSPLGTATQAQPLIDLFQAAIDALTPLVPGS